MDAWGRCALALLSYRQGRFEKSREWAELSLKNSDEASRVCINKLVLSMIDLREKRWDEANTRLEEPRALVKQWEATPMPLVANKAASWFNGGNVKVLLNEAEAMLAKRKD